MIVFSSFFEKSLKYKPSNSLWNYTYCCNTFDKVTNQINKLLGWKQKQGTNQVVFALSDSPQVGY